MCSFRTVAQTLRKLELPQKFFKNFKICHIEKFSVSELISIERKMNESVNSVALSTAKTYGCERSGASGILMSDDWVMSHGSLLNAQVERNPNLRVFLDNLTPGKLTSMPRNLNNDMKVNVFQRHLVNSWTENSIVGIDSLNQPSRPKVEVMNGYITAAWKCPLIEKTFRELMYDWSFDKTRNIDRSLLSVFLTISLKKKIANEWSHVDDEAVILQNIRRVLTQFVNNCKPPLRHPVRASLVEVSSTPFGNPIFIDLLSRGVVSNVLGEDQCLMLTDANAVPGSEGAPVYVISQE